jgi:hypothetical protein
MMNTEFKGCSTTHKGHPQTKASNLLPVRGVWHSFAGVYTEHLFTELTFTVTGIVSLSDDMGRRILWLGHSKPFRFLFSQISPRAEMLEKLGL